MLLVACKSSTPTPDPQPSPPAVDAESSEPEQGQATRFDPATVSDAAFTDDECLRFAELRAADPQEPLTADEYAKECRESTGSDPPWLRRASRCLLVAADKEQRGACFTEQLTKQREDSEARLEAQIEAERVRVRQERIQEAERILREARAAEIEADAEAEDSSR